jgi:hypothetical protein
MEVHSRSQSQPRDDEAFRPWWSVMTRSIRAVCRHTMQHLLQPVESTTKSLWLKSIRQHLYSFSLAERNGQRSHHTGATSRTLCAHTIVLTIWNRFWMIMQSIRTSKATFLPLQWAGRGMRSTTMAMAEATANCGTAMSGMGRNH